MAYRRDTIMPPLWILTLIGAVLLAWVAYELKELVVLFVVGYFIAYAIDPLLAFLERRGISRPTGVFTITALLSILLLVLVFSAVPSFISEYDRLVENLPNYQRAFVDRALPLLERVERYLPVELVGDDPVEKLVNYLSTMMNSATLGSIMSGIAKTLLSGYSLTLTFFNLILLPFIVYYLAVDLPTFHARALACVPHLRQEKVRRIVGEIDGYVSAFIRGQLLVCTVLFALYAVGFRIVGLELWVLLAFISGFGNLVPYLGFAVGIVLSSLVALVTSHSFSSMLAVWGVFAVVQGLEGTVITPKILGDQTGLSPLVILLAVCAGGQLFGLLGIFLAVPAAAIGRVLLVQLHGWLMHKV